MSPEALAREHIDGLLTQSGWTVQRYRDFDPSLSHGVALTEVPLKVGTADYLLLVDKKPVGVIEAKKEGTPLSGVAEQSGHYGENLPDFLSIHGSLPFAYESTGIETFFRDHRDPDPRSRRLFAFHRPETLAEWLAAPGTLRQRLAQLPFAHPLKSEGMRGCQIEAVSNLEKSLAADHPRALIQMATGAGKTYTACAFTYRLIKHAGARRILFLVDRANLGRQAKSEFDQFVTPDTGRKFTELYNLQHLTSNHLDSVARVTICTIQRLYSMLRGEELDEDIDEISGFELAAADNRPRDVAYNSAIPIETFDFIVTDECHRSIYNLWRQVLEYFDAFLIGLTATPSKQTIGFFNQNLVMEYNHERAVADGVNVGYDVYRIQTEVTQRGGHVEKGFYIDRRSKETAANLTKSFRDYIDAHRVEIEALQILYSRPYKQRLTEKSLKELEDKLKDEYGPEPVTRLWRAFELTVGETKEGGARLPPSRSQIHRFADLVPLVRYALEQQPVLEPFSESVQIRFETWLDQKAKAGVTFTTDQRAWLDLIKEHISTSLSMDQDDFEYAPFSQRGGLGKAHQLFGNDLPKIVEELNEVLAA